MAIDSTNIELFQTGKEFNQIHFLDNFYVNVAIEQEAEQDLSKLLAAAVNNSRNTYVRRSSFKIICELTLANKITNRFSALSILHDFLSSDENILQAIALKYLPHFTETRTVDTLEKLKELSDSSNGEVAGQASFCLGLIQLTTSISHIDVAQLVINFGKAKLHFQASAQASENRIDAEFYLSLIGWSEAVFTNNPSLAEARFKKLEKNLQLRNMYEFAGTGLELDFLIFQLTEQIKASYDTASTSTQWIETKPQIHALFNINLEIQRIRNITSSNQSLTEKVFSSVLKNLETNIYQVNLLSEKQRLRVLQSQALDSRLKRFIKYLISLFPDSTTTQPENHELLILLAENLDNDSGLQLYEQISDKSMSPEVSKAIGHLLQKNKSNQLPFRTGSITGHEVLTSLMSQIDCLLPDYSSEKSEAFSNILEEVIRYARSTLVGNDRKRFIFLYNESEGGKGQKALEHDLQDSMITYFEHSKISDGLGHEQTKFVDGGRVDILYKKDLITIPIELKKSLNRPDQTNLELNYIGQAQTYTAGYDQLGIFVLLELSDKAKESPPNFKDWFQIHHLPPATNLNVNYPDYIISVVIPGNRTTPSAKSTYK